MADFTDPGADGATAGQPYLAKSYAAGNVVPDLEIAPGFDLYPGGYVTSLSVTGHGQIGSAGEDSDPQTPQVAPNSSFAVTPGDIYHLEKTIMAELAPQAAAYEEFKKKIIDTEGWMFLVQDPEKMIPYDLTQDRKPPTGSSGGSSSDGSPFTGSSGGHGNISAISASVDWGTDFTDPSPDKTQQVVDGQNKLLKALGDCLEMTSGLVMRLNNAAQNYASADQHSFHMPLSVDDLGKVKSPFPNIIVR